jgi:deazaflavin-dependent oxidoreductase (nitroreductase family)
MTRSHREGVGTGARSANARRRPPLRTGLKDAIFRLSTGIHRALFTISNGRLLGTVLGMPVVTLVTTGRTSGKQRSTMLTAPVVDGERLVLVASFGGDDRHPAWYRNLQANPNVRVTFAGSTRTMVARVASDEEKAQLWPRIIAAAPVYAGYQQKTERHIPVVILDPVQVRDRSATT